MTNNCLQTRPSQGCSMIFAHGSEPPVHDNNNRNIFIYDKRMSHLCIAEQTVRQVEQTKRGVRCAPPHHGRIRIYGTLPRLPPGNEAIFKAAGSPGAGVRLQTTDGDERAVAPVRAQTHFQRPHFQDELEARDRRVALLMSATTAPKALIGMID